MLLLLGPSIDCFVGLAGQFGLEGIVAPELTRQQPAHQHMPLPRSLVQVCQLHLLRTAHGLSEPCTYVGPAAKVACPQTRRIRCKLFSQPQAC